APLSCLLFPLSSCFFLSPTAPSDIYSLSLHDALPICRFLRYLNSDRPDSCAVLFLSFRSTTVDAQLLSSLLFELFYQKSKVTYGRSGELPVGKKERFEYTPV